MINSAKERDEILKIQKEKTAKYENLIKTLKQTIKKTQEAIEDVKTEVIKEESGLQIGHMYRFRKGGRLDFRGYLSKIENGEVHLDICLANGELTGKKFSRDAMEFLQYAEVLKERI